MSNEQLSSNESKAAEVLHFGKACDYVSGLNLKRDSFSPLGKEEIAARTTKHKESHDAIHLAKKQANSSWTLYVTQKPEIAETSELKQALELLKNNFEAYTLSDDELLLLAYRISKAPNLFREQTNFQYDGLRGLGKYCSAFSKDTRYKLDPETNMELPEDNNLDFSITVGCAVNLMGGLSSIDDTAHYSEDREAYKNCMKQRFLMDMRIASTNGREVFAAPFIGSGLFINSLSIEEQTARRKMIAEAFVAAVEEMEKSAPESTLRQFALCVPGDEQFKIVNEAFKKFESDKTTLLLTHATTGALIKELKAKFPNLKIHNDIAGHDIDAGGNYVDCVISGKRGPAEENEMIISNAPGVVLSQEPGEIIAFDNEGKPTPIPISENLNKAFASLSEEMCKPKENKTLVATLKAHYGEGCEVFRNKSRMPMQDSKSSRVYCSNKQMAKNMRNLILKKLPPEASNFLSLNNDDGFSVQIQNDYITVLDNTAKPIIFRKKTIEIINSMLEKDSAQLGNEQIGFYDDRWLIECESKEKAEQMQKLLLDNSGIDASELSIISSSVENADRYWIAVPINFDVKYEKHQQLLANFSAYVGLIGDLQTVDVRSNQHHIALTVKKEQAECIAIELKTLLQKNEKDDGVTTKADESDPGLTVIEVKADVLKKNSFKLEDKLDTKKLTNLLNTLLTQNGNQIHFFHKKVQISFDNAEDANNVKTQLIIRLPELKESIKACKTEVAFPRSMIASLVAAKNNGKEEVEENTVNNAPETETAQIEPFIRTEEAKPESKEQPESSNQQSLQNKVGDILAQLKNAIEGKKDWKLGFFGGQKVVTGFKETRQMPEHAAEVYKLFKPYINMNTCQDDIMRARQILLDRNKPKGAINSIKHALKAIDVFGLFCRDADTEKFYKDALQFLDEKYFNAETDNTDNRTAPQNKNL